MFVLFLPYIVATLFMLGLLLLLFRKWWWSALLVLASLCLNAYVKVWALHPMQEFGQPEADIRCMTYNIHGSADDFADRILPLSQFIGEQAPDILSLNEYYEASADSLYRLLSVQYPYSTYPQYLINGNMIFSKWPISDVKVIALPPEQNYLSCVADINGTPLLVVCCHLTSNNYLDLRTPIHADSIRSVGGALLYSQAIRRAYRMRSMESDTLRHCLEQEPYPILLMGDLNDISGSKTLQTLEAAGLQDAWWTAGHGIGSTFCRGLLRLRLDHILYSQPLAPTSIEVIDPGLSDHKAIVAGFRLLK